MASDKLIAASEADTAIVMEALPPESQRPRTRRRTAKPTKPSTRNPQTRQPKADKKAKLSKDQLVEIAARVKSEVRQEEKPAMKRRGTRTDDPPVRQGKKKPALKTVTPDSQGTQKKTKKKPPGKGAKDQGKFSETQWFMVGVETDADLLEAVDSETYDRDESIAEKKRDEFTLREDED